MPVFENALETLGGGFVTGGPDAEGKVPIDVYLTEKPARATLDTLIATAAVAAGVPEPEVLSQPLPDTDWLQQSYESIPPISAGRFYVHGRHHTDQPRPAGKIPFLIEAAQAFGTGHHESTRGCLLALDALARRGVRVGRALDVGTGTGVLAFAAARLWRCPAVAVDNDPIAVRVCRENIRVNGVARWVTAAVSDGYKDRRVHESAPYDLITANILAEPLISMAGQLDAHLAPGGHAVLAGLLNRQARKVFRRHRAQGLVLERRIVLGDWTTLILRKPNKTARLS
jgi:ribosomal protein L11 methyltransferase